MTDNLHQEEIKPSLDRKLARQVVEHRNDFHDFFIKRYLEMLVNLYQYNIPVFDKASAELALRQNYGIVFGRNKLGQDTILGYIMCNDTFGDNANYLYRRRFTGRDVTFTLPNSLLPEKAKTASFVEIWDADKALTGDFVVIRNKQLNITNDYQIIRYYADELAEIEASRYSLIMQSKILTVIAGEPGDQGINQMVSSIYNGNPFVKISDKFDIEDNIITIDNGNLSGNLSQLKAEYQTKLAELNAIFGINILSVDKESGVTNSEANGNLSYVTGNGNIWLESRQKALNLYNQRFGTDYQVSMDTDNGNTLSVDDGEARDDHETKVGEM